MTSLFLSIRVDTILILHCAPEGHEHWIEKHIFGIRWRPQNVEYFLWLPPAAPVIGITPRWPQRFSLRSPGAGCR